MNKKWRVILLSIFITLIVGGYIYYDSFHAAPNRLKIRYETINSTKITEELSGLSIAVFSDLHYNHFMNKERFSAIVDEINKQNCDVVVFLGDLFDHPSSNIPSEATQKELIELLSQIKAPYGKFAVYGNHDLESGNTKNIVRTVLEQSDFEVLDNQMIPIYRNSKSYIQLIGLDCKLLGNPLIEVAGKNINPELFTLLLCHTPDVVNELGSYPVELMLSGHSHGGQVYIPILGALYKVPYATDYYRGKYKVHSTLLDVTNGTGTTRYDVRLLADPEVIVYQLQHE